MPSPYLFAYFFLNFHSHVNHCRPAPNFSDAMGGHVPPTAWHPMSPQGSGPASNPGIRSMGSQLLPRSGDLAIPLNPVRIIVLWNIVDFYIETVLISNTLF